MADKKISALTAASTPLAGTEVLPIVQGGSTVKVSAANITAGRTIDVSGLNASFAPTSSSDAAPVYIARTTGADFGVGDYYQAGSTSNAGYFGRRYLTTVGWCAAVTGSNAVVINTGNLGSEVERVRVDGSGNISAVTGNFVVGTAGKGITTGGATALGLGANNTVTAVTIDTSNNVGINTPGNPNARFEVYDGAIRFGNASGNGFLFADGTATLAGSLSNHPLHLYTNNTKRAEIDISGNISAGVGALATNATNGFLYIPTCPGVPTGTPTTKTGLAPLVVDSTNNKLYVYVGGSWVAMN